MIFGLKVEEKPIFRKELMIPGEAVIISDAKEMIFCFDYGKYEILKISEEVDKQTAEKFIALIEEYINKK